MLLEGSYELIVEGHFRNGSAGFAFKHRKTLQLESRSVHIIIRVNKPIYRQDDLGLLLYL